MFPILMLTGDVNVVFIYVITSKQQQLFSSTTNNQSISEEFDMFVSCFSVFDLN